MIKEYSVGAVVYNADQFLILKYGLRHWGLVKGHKEEGETDEENRGRNRCRIRHRTSHRLASRTRRAYNYCRRHSRA